MIYGIGIIPLFVILIAGIVLALVHRYGDEIAETILVLFHYLIHRDSFTMARQMAKLERRKTLTEKITDAEWFLIITHENRFGGST